MTKHSYYEFFKCTEPKSEDLDLIIKDLDRTYSGNQKPAEWDDDPIIGGSNPLFNILVAYANFDREAGYGQGLNFVAAFILLNTKVINPEGSQFGHLRKTGDTDEEEFDEVTAFFILVYVMHSLGHRRSLDRKMTLVFEHMATLEMVLKHEHPTIVAHIEKVFDDNLASILNYT